MTARPAARKPDGFFIALVIVGVFTIGCAWFFRSAVAPGMSNQISKPFPMIEAVGWINGSAPTAADLQDHVVVIDAWAYWCVPCRGAIPELITLHKKYKDRGVIFLGMTSEGTDPETMEASRDFVQSLKVPWVNGYGAEKTFSDLHVSTIPQLWVVNRQNRIVYHELGWVPSSPDEIDRAIAKALNESTQEEQPSGKLSPDAASEK